jgi:hypothetical protein
MMAEVEAGGILEQILEIHMREPFQVGLSK